MADHKLETHHIVPHCLLTLHEKANGTSLNGEGIQAWLEWEIEAMRWRVPTDISRTDLEALVEELASQVTCSKPLETISNGEERG